MQYVGKVGGYMYNQWNSLNPATLSGAIDIIVVEQSDGSLHCSPWHVRFGKFQIIKPSQKKIDLYVNDIKTDLPMKLGEGGEAFFVFEADKDSDLLSQSVLTSPVISPVSSPASSPDASTQDLNRSEPELLDLNNEEEEKEDREEDIEKKIKLSESATPKESMSPVPSIPPKVAFEKARKITQKLNIPSKIDINGDMVLDMDGYKPNAQKNIENSDELFKRIFLSEIEKLGPNNENEVNIWNQIISKDEDGNIRILNNSMGNEVDVDDLTSVNGLLSNPELSDTESSETPSKLPVASDKAYFKTLRLTSEQLQKMNLSYGENTLKFKLSEGNSQIISNLYLWKYSTPIVISDIDGTITKSDALGHVLNLFGKDWTHPGVANLFQDINLNGYNIVYLTSRSVGQSDSTRQYLKGIIQDGVKLPSGPVILSPDRTMAALKREVILRKPEVFKMACLNDIKSLYFDGISDNEDDRTPFYAGFGNRITDAISYRSVKIPSHRIFTINPNGEVHMELLELAGYKSSYLHIGELVDQFFPPIKSVSAMNSYWNDNQFNEYISHSKEYRTPSPGSPKSVEGNDPMINFKTDEKYNDVNYWREPLNFSDLSDLEDDEDVLPSVPKSPTLKSIRSYSVSDDSDSDRVGRGKLRSPSESERLSSPSSFSPLKNFMMLGSNSNKGTLDSHESSLSNDSDYTGEEEDEDDYDDDEYDDDDYEEQEDEDEDEEDEEDDDEDDYSDDDDYEDEFDNEEDLDFGDPPTVDDSEPVPTDLNGGSSFIKASDLRA